MAGKTCLDPDAICEAIDKGHGGFPAGARAKLEAARDYLAVAPMVVRVATDAPVPEVDGGLPVSQDRGDTIGGRDGSRQLVELRPHVGLGERRLGITAGDAAAAGEGLARLRRHLDHRLVEVGEALIELVVLDHGHLAREARHFLVGPAAVVEQVEDVQPVARQRHR